METKPKILHGTYRFLAYSSTIQKHQRELFDFSPDANNFEYLVYLGGSLEEYYFLENVELSDNRDAIEAESIWHVALKEYSRKNWQVEPIEDVNNIPLRVYGVVYEDMYDQAVAAAEDSIDYADIRDAAVRDY